MKLTRVEVTEIRKAALNSALDFHAQNGHIDAAKVTETAEKFYNFLTNESNE